VTADWIIQLLAEPTKGEINLICLNLGDKGRKTVPESLRKYLEGHGIRIIDYPEGEPYEEANRDYSPISLGSNRNSVIEKVLELTGQQYSLKTDIPLYKGEGSDFNLTIKADYSFSRRGKDFIIDQTGIEPDVINLLNERGFSVLSLAAEQDLCKAAGMVLDFLGEEWSDGDKGFYALPEDGRGNVKLVIPGVIYRDTKGRMNLFTYIRPAQEMTGFLSNNVESIFILGREAESEGNERQDTGN
jgi:hypothetical protein